MRYVTGTADNFPFVFAAWGATGRGEGTSRSDVDILCWTPQLAMNQRSRIEAAIRASGVSGTYIDLLFFDGSHSLEDWARATATDYQAVLFATDLEGPQNLVNQFERTQQNLWSDYTTRAREVWMLVSETLLHPRTMEISGFFRPEKYRVGATRSFVTVAETYAMLRGWQGSFTTKAGLTATERLLGWQAGQLNNGYNESLQLRHAIEQGSDPNDYCVEYQKLGAMAGLRTKSF